MDIRIVTGLIIISIIIAFITIIIIYQKNYHKVPPNKAMVIFGAKTPGTRKGYRIITGGGKFLMPVVESAKYLPLDVRNLSFELKNVKTDPKTEKATLKLEVAATIKIASDPMSLDTAAEQLLDKSDEEINKIAYDVIEAHIRGICRTMKFEDIDTDRDLAAERIQLMAAKDLHNIGLEIRSIVIKNVVKIN
jgi:flotillin